MEDLPLDDVDKALIERLSASNDDDSDDATWLRGRGQGYYWASQHASVFDLRRLVQDRSLRMDWCYDVDLSPYSDAERFFFVIRPDQDGDRTAAAEFWEYETSTPLALSRSTFVQGFFHGAMNAFKPVKGRV